MKKVILLVFIYCFTLTSVFAAPAKVVFFGDSLTDTGNLYRATENTLPNSPPYYKGRFSNGPLWSDRVAEYFLKKHGISSKNYASGGATILSIEENGNSLVPNLSGQINQYLTEAQETEIANTLFVIWIGSNDYFVDDDPELLSSKVNHAMRMAILSLIKNGARDLLILNLPDLSKCPLAKTITFFDKLKIYSELNNKKLDDLIAEVRAEGNASVNIKRVDVFSTFNDIFKNLQHYNEKYNIHIQNLNEACFTGSYFPPEAKPELANKYNLTVAATTKKQMGLSDILVCDKPMEYFFWDFLHPSAPAHKLIANMVIERFEQA